jgi:PKD repeat protein
VVLTLTETSDNAKLSAPHTTTVVITDDDVVSAAFLQDTFTVTEDVGEATVTTTLDITSSQLVTVAYTTGDGDATAWRDYAPQTGVLTQGVLTITVPITDDNFDEPNETVVLTLTETSDNAKLSAPHTTTVVITDDDVVSAAFLQDTFTVTEDVGEATVTTTLDITSSQIVTVAHNTGDGTAEVDRDYSSGTGVLTYPSGKNLLTFTVPITDDDDAEVNETVLLTLTAKSNNTELVIPYTATLIIIDNDPSDITVDFSAVPVSGTIPLSVTFIDMSQGDKLNGWFWRFGDGITSTLQNPTHIYTSNNWYTVTLTVFNNIGSRTITRTNYITVVPAISISADSRFGQVPFDVTFTDNSNGLITERLWDFGDGITSSLAVTQHTYNTNNFYTVTLTITGPGGNVTVMQPDYITVTPKADFSITPREGRAPLTVSFYDMSIENIDYWEWDLGNDITSTTRNVSYTYHNPGCYPVTLKVLGPGGYDTVNHKYIDVWYKDVDGSFKHSCNTPPTINQLAIKPAVPDNYNDLEVSYIYTDANDHSEGDTNINWSCNNENTPRDNCNHTTREDLKNLRIIPYTEVYPDDEWCVWVTPHDGIDYGAEVGPACVKISKNQRPQASHLYITPTVPSPQVTLTLVYSYTDPDDSNGTPHPATQIRWYRDGQLQPGLNDTLVVPISTTISGEVWSATVKPYDGYDYGRKSDPVSVTVKGVSSQGLPEVYSVTVTPLHPRGGEGLTVTHQPQINVPFTVRKNWYRNNVFQPIYSGEERILFGGSNKPALPGDIWYATIQVCNNTECGDLYRSNQVVIRENEHNYIPEVIYPMIYPAQPRITDTLKLYYRHKDQDGDSLTEDTQVRWYRNRRLQPRFNNLREVNLREDDAVFTRPGDSWYATILPYDGEEYGMLAQTPEVIIKALNNTMPQVRNAHINLPQPGDNDYPRLEYTYTDADHDFEGNTQIEWFKSTWMENIRSRWTNEVVSGWVLAPQPQYTGLTAILSNSTEISETLFAIVVPQDERGEKGIAVEVPSSVVLENRGNTAPEALNPTISPDNPTIHDRLELHYEYQDSDGDAEMGTKIKWSLNNDFDNWKFFDDLTTIYIEPEMSGTWCAHITPNDGEQQGETVKACTYVRESGGSEAVPRAENLHIYPPILHEDQGMQLIYDFSSSDHIEGNTVIRWYKEGVLQPIFDDLTFVPAEYISAGDVWSATVQPYGWSTEKLTHTPGISVSTQPRKKNHPPKVLSAVIYPTRTLLANNEWLRLDYEYYDKDGDREMLGGRIIKWYKNGELLTSTNSDLLSPIYTSPGKRITASIQVYDGKDCSDPYESNNMASISGDINCLYLYLPLVMKDPGPEWICNESDFYEENDGKSQSCGPILQSRSPYFVTADDEVDWFLFCPDRTTSISVTVNNYPSQSYGQLSIYKHNFETGNLDLIAEYEESSENMILPNDDAPDVLRNRSSGIYFAVIETERPLSTEIYRLNLRYTDAKSLLCGPEYVLPWGTIE